MVLFMVLMVQKNLNALNSKRWNPVFETKKPSSRNASGPKKSAILVRSNDVSNLWNLKRSIFQQPHVVPQ